MSATTKPGGIHGATFRLATAQAIHFIGRLFPETLKGGQTVEQLESKYNAAIADEKKAYDNLMAKLTEKYSVAEAVEISTLLRCGEWVDDYDPLADEPSYKDKVEDMTGDFFDPKTGAMAE